MDIQKKGYFQQLNIKNLTLKATASAILVLNAEIAKAATCPSQIVGTALENIVCNFTAGVSVTVTNGGTVGGIAMNSYNPLSGQLVINAGGLVNNTTSGSGINITHSSLSNGLINNGTINTMSSATGILISNSAVGGLSNSGTISAGATGVRIVNTSTINGSISNSGTITGGGIDEGITIEHNNTINGNISNTGVIKTAGSGNGIVIGSANNIYGNLSNSGTINVGTSGIEIFDTTTIHGNLSNSGSIMAAAGKGIRINNASQITDLLSNSGSIKAATIGMAIYSASSAGSLSNSGTISGGSTGIAVTSSSTISGGISNSGIIQGDIFAINIDPSSAVNNIDIIGQNARLIGGVNAVNTTVNITSGAAFTSNGTFNVDNFNIASNALFNMANTITAAGNVANAGTLAIENTQQTITGNYTQNAGGTLQIGATSTRNYGRLTVSGAANLSNSGNINVQLAQNYSLHPGDVLSNVISGSSLIAPTNGFTVTDNSFIWEFIADPGVGVNLTAAINPAVYEVCQGYYCQGAATVIIGQVAAGNSVFNPYALLATGSALQAAASQATPELTNGNIQAVQLITNAVMDLAPLWSALHGKAAGDEMPYQSGKLWVKPYGALMTQNKNHTVDGFTVKAFGVAIGKDMQAAENWLLGGAFAAGRDGLYGKSLLSGQTIYSDSYQGILYGARKFPYNFYVGGQGSVGYENNNTKRFIPLYTSASQGSFNSWFTNLRAQLGWSAYTPNQKLILTPELEANYLFVNQAGYRESGSLMDLSVASNNNSSLVLGAYGYGAYNLTTLKTQQDLTLTAYAGVARNVLNGQPKVTAAFVAGGENFSTFGGPFNRFVLRGGAGLSLESATSSFKMNLNYDAQVGNNAYSSIGSVTVIYKI